MTFEELLTRQRARINKIITDRNARTAELDELRGQDAPDTARIGTIRAELGKLDADLARENLRLEAFQREADEDAELTRAAEETHPTGAGVGVVRTELGTTTQRDERDQWVYAGTGERAALRAGEQLREHPVFERIQAKRHGEDYMLDRYANLGQMIRALTTSGASANVPTLWAGDFIDLARNKAAVGKAGASIIPMEAKQVNIARITGDATAAFRDEGGSITASDPTLDQVQLIAKSLSSHIKVTREWMQDAEDAEEVVVDALANAIALKIDEVALYGGIVTGDASGKNLPTTPNPRGVLAALNAVLAANVLGNAGNGTTQTSTAFWQEIIAAVYQVRNGNEDPNAIIWSIKAEQQYANATDTTGQPLLIPPALADIARHATKQVPNYTKGTMTNRATDVFVGDWSKLLIGERLDLQIEVNTQLFAETGHIGIFAHWRGDVQPARPAAFSVYRALQGAA